MTEQDFVSYGDIDAERGGCITVAEKAYLDGAGLTIEEFHRLQEAKGEALFRFFVENPNAESIIILKR